MSTVDPTTLDRLRRELQQLVETHKVSTWSCDLLRAIISAIELQFTGPVATRPTDVNQLLRELGQRLQRQPYGAYSPELLRALDRPVQAVAALRSRAGLQDMLSHQLDPRW